MADPTTTNRGFAVPTRGSDVGVWDVPVNGNFTLLDTALGALTTVNTTGGTTTLTPTQYANGVINVTGTLTGTATIVFPSVQGWWSIFNQTSGNFVLLVTSGAATSFIGIPQGELIDIFVANNQQFYRNMGKVGGVEIWAGYSSMPGWVTSSTTVPYLLCDGTVYSIASFPIIGNRYKATFGGNGTTTFGVPDLRGRVPLPWDSTGSRVTPGGSGLNGQVIGSALDQQTVTLSLAQIPSHNHTLTDPGHTHTWAATLTSRFFGNFGTTGSPIAGMQNNNGNDGNYVNSVNTTGISIAAAGGGAAHNNIQPTLVTGIAVVRAA